MINSRIVRLALVASLILIAAPLQAADWKMVWHDEFDQDGSPDPANWDYERGFVRNQELQYYQPENATCRGGFLVIEARRERKPNPGYRPDGKGWKNRQWIEYTSACLVTKGKHEFTYGKFEMRGRIDTRSGSWPAFWSLGASIDRTRWPECGEIDIMEYYSGTLLANVCHLFQGKQKWTTTKRPIPELGGEAWARQFHVWTMEWDERSIDLLLDGQRLTHFNVVDDDEPGKDNAFRKPQYLLLNQAIGSTGGDPSKTEFPVRLEVDWVRVYQRAGGREIHVAANGNDGSSGGASAPYRTIGKAAAEAQPGDVVTVHGGVYREWVKPSRGGAGPSERITYRAAANEKVSIRGSERVTGWSNQGNGVWRVEVKNTLFGDYNPFAIELAGGWYYGDKWRHLGDVYLDGEPLKEVEKVAQVTGVGRTWYAEAGDQVTTIWAGFGACDPNAALAEINVRKAVFYPQTTGLDYITVRGFHLGQAACQWAPPNAEQPGVIGPFGGRSWVIENCTVTDGRCVGISLGTPRQGRGEGIDRIGHHLVRNNIVRRCGQAGIAGLRYNSASEICGNLVEQTNFRREFDGHEIAGIKLHCGADTVIRGNCIRNTYLHPAGKANGWGDRGNGIWIDYANQGTRISGNVFVDIEGLGLYLECNHGPILVDNNVFISDGSVCAGSAKNSEACVFVHNLFYRVHVDFRRETRSPEYYRPHTVERVATTVIAPRDDRWYNNIFIGGGLERAPDAPGYRIDNNVYLGGAAKSRYDAHSIVDTFAPAFTYTSSASGVRISFAMNDAPLGLACPLIDHAFVGIFPLVKQGIEDREGKPITVDVDYFGRPRNGSRPLVGPFADLKSGVNEYVLFTVGGSSPAP